MNASDIHHSMKNVYGDEIADQTAVSSWEIKLCASEAGKLTIEDKPHTGWPVSVTDKNHQKESD